MTVANPSQPPEFLAVFDDVSDTPTRLAGLEMWFQAIERNLHEYHLRLRALEALLRKPHATQRSARTAYLEMRTDWSSDIRAEIAELRSSILRWSAGSSDADQRQFDAYLPQISERLITPLADLDSRYAILIERIATLPPGHSGAPDHFWPSDGEPGSQHA